MVGENLSTEVRTLWKGRPWILPNLLARTVLAVAAAIVIISFELSFGVGSRTFFAVETQYWTALAIFIVWLLATAQLLLQRASSEYILRSDGLEIRVGILTSKSFVIAPAGFSDLEVTRSISARIVNSGNITVRTQGENDLKMTRVRNPMKVAEQIRKVMARPLIRIGREETIDENVRKH